MAGLAQNLTVNATGENEAKVEGITFGAAIGLIGVSARVGDASTNSTSTTRAYIENGSAAHRIKVFGTLDVDATYTNKFDKDLKVVSVATTGAGAGIYADHNVNSTVFAEFGDNLQIEAGNIDVDALNTSTKLNRRRIARCGRFRFD